MHLEGMYPNNSRWFASGTHPTEGHRGLPSSVEEVCFLLLLSFLSVCVCYKNILKSCYMASAPILHYHSSKQNNGKEFCLPQPSGQPPLTAQLSVLKLVYTTDE